jgi:hypothetical protein
MRTLAPDGHLANNEVPIYINGARKKRKIIFLI